MQINLHELPKAAILDILLEKSCELPPNPRKSMNRDETIILVSGESACLKPDLFRQSPATTKTSKTYLVNRLAAIHESHGYPFWISSWKRKSYKYLLDYLYTIHPEDEIFFGNVNSKPKRRLKNPRKSSRFQFNLAPLRVTEDALRSALQLFNSCGDFFRCVANYDQRRITKYNLSSAKVRYNIIRKVDALAHLIKLI